MKVESFKAGEIWVEVSDEDSVELQNIVTHHLPIWLKQFAKKNEEYQDDAGTAFVLGEKGQFSDIYRKVMKLKRAIWDGKHLNTEPVEEILLDFIGHCFLTLEMRRLRGTPGTIDADR